MHIITRARHLGSWEPFTELEKASSIFSLLDAALPRVIDPADRAWGPAVDVQDEAGKVTVKADLPGIDRKDVEVSVEDGTLIIRGEKKEESKTREKGYVRTERAYGAFYRSIELPVEVDESKVSAQYKDGVLEVILPKRAETKPATHKVEVK